MGDFRVRKILDSADRRQAYLHHTDDLRAFEIMLAENMFDNGPVMIGAEQELCIVDSNSQPTLNALKLLDEINDEHYTNELALFNLEINLDPYFLKDDCFHKVEESLKMLLAKGQDVAAMHDAHLLLCGILPTLKYRHLQFEYMTPIQRYQTLSEELAKIRGRKFDIYLQGADDLIMSLGSVLFEACNTSFQLHLQIPQNKFVEQHNWSQMLAGPVMSVAANSPMLFGQELWAETRIALFKQSLDTRSAEKYMRSKLARVYFGMDWLKESPAEIWRNNLSRFPLLLTSDGFEKATDVLAKGGIPKLRAVRLQNGTTYTWNRLCYGPTKPKPHLRIECRYLPSGPSMIDEMANFAFWIGLMQAGEEFKKDLPQKVKFKSAKNNFIRASRTGLATVFNWFGKLRPAKELLLESLLPMAKSGLEKSNVRELDIQRFLSVIEQRVENEKTGSDWIVENFRILKEAYGTATAEAELVKLMLENQKANIPVHEWPTVDSSRSISIGVEQCVEYLMTRDVISVHEEDSIEHAIHVMDWNNIHHLPVENQEGELVGLLTDGMLRRYLEENGRKQFVHEIMLLKVVTIQAEDHLSDLLQKMKVFSLSGLPVVYGNKLVGMITTHDIAHLRTKKNSLQETEESESA